jgi:hypothetical protein
MVFFLCLVSRYVRTPYITSSIIIYRILNFHSHRNLGIQHTSSLHEILTQIFVFDYTVFWCGSLVFTRFEALAAVNIKFAVFLDVTLYSLTDVFSTLKIEALCTSEKLGTIYQTTRLQSSEDHSPIISLLFGSFGGKSLFWKEFIKPNLLQKFQSVY